MYKEHVQKSIREVRITKGYTQQEVADMTGIPQTTIARIESGSRQPNLENLGKLIDFYGVSSDMILGTGKREE